MDISALRRVLGRAYRPHDSQVSFDDHTGTVCDGACRSDCRRERLRTRLALHGLHQ